MSYRRAINHLDSAHQNPILSECVVWWTKGSCSQHLALLSENPLMKDAASVRRSRQRADVASELTTAVRQLRSYQADTHAATEAPTRQRNQIRQQSLWRCFVLVHLWQRSHPTRPPLSVQSRATRILLIAHNRGISRRGQWGSKCQSPAPAWGLLCRTTVTAAACWRPRRGGRSYQPHTHS